MADLNSTCLNFREVSSDSSLPWQFHKLSNFKTIDLSVTYHSLSGEDKLSPTLSAKNFLLKPIKKRWKHPLIKINGNWSNGRPITFSLLLCQRLLWKLSLNMLAWIIKDSYLQVIMLVFWTGSAKLNGPRSAQFVSNRLGSGNLPTEEGFDKLEDRKFTPVLNTVSVVPKQLKLRNST